MHLPCKNCGSSLAIIKGSKAQCPYCGAKTLYMESVYSLKHYLTEVLNLTSLKNETHVKNKELERRKFLVRTFFNKLKSNYNDYRHLIITKLDDITVNPKNLFHVIRSAGNLELIVERFLLPYLNDDKIVQKYKELRDHCFVINKSLIGLYYSYLAKNSVYIDKCLKYYDMVEKNYQNIVDYCNITNIENNKSKLFKKKELFQILTEFTKILRDILNRNPKYFSEKLEVLLKRLEKFDEKNFQTYTLYSQIEHIYQLERDTCVLLEKVKVDTSFSAEQALDEDIIFNTEENLEKLNVVRDRINNISEKYQNYQRKLLKLHSGSLIQYLESYRTEFINFKNKNVDKFNDLLETMIHKAFKAYNSEAIEVLKSLSDFIQDDIFNEKTIERFENEHNDLTELDEILKRFINDLFSKPILRNLEKGYYKKLISLISGKHTEFDNYILKFINFTFQKFEENRNKKILSLEEQKNQFSSELKPNLQKLLNLSFNLNEKKLPYPLFIDIETQNKKLSANEPEVINLVIENPNLIDIKDIKIYFFMPRSFHSKVKSKSIKKLKAKERRKIKTKILPTRRGTFLFMVMAEYHHVNKTFWMPSIKLKLEVEEIVKYKYYPPHTINYNNGYEATRVLAYIRNHVI